MKTYENLSFWQEDIGAGVTRQPLTENIRADVCIIGAGFTGLSTAIHLKEKRPDLNVTVLEADFVGYGASGRNAGFSMRLFGVTMELTMLLHGKKKTKEADAYLVDAVEYLEEMIKRYDIDCNYERNGMMTVATNRKELKQLYKEIKAASELGLEGLTLLDGERTKQIVHSPTYLNARFDEYAALLHPAKLVNGLAETAESLGVTIYEQSKVIDVHENDRIVLTEAGSVQAEKIVFATNAYSSFYPALDKKQIPIYTYIVLTEPLTEAQLNELRWEPRVGIEDARNFLHYYRLTHDNRILLGGSEALYYYDSPLHENRNERMKALLIEDFFDIFPQLKGIKFTHHWGGPISATLDLIPSIGRINDDIWYSIGCMGHGVSFTNYNGLTLAELILGERSKRTEFFIINRREIPLPPEPLRYMTVSAIRNYLRYEDKKGKKEKLR